LGVLACLHGGYWGAAAGAFMWGLSKETAFLSPALTWASGNELAESPDGSVGGGKVDPGESGHSMRAVDMEGVQLARPETHH
jgi:hypothetical protein